MKTLKYRPNYQPKGFATLEEAREWVSLFVKWYNHDHHHSGLKFLTPYQRRSGLSDKILAKRKEVYEAAKTEHPERWNGRLTRDLEPSGHSVSESGENKRRSRNCC
ncbi:MAG: integrase core domain-containing protein [Clostridiaceae bacterium]